MTTHLDSRLAAALHSAVPDDLLEAALVVREPSPAPDDGGLAQQVVARAATRSGCQPVSARYLPRANAAVLTAPAAFWVEILKDADVYAVGPVMVEGMDARPPTR